MHLTPLSSRIAGDKSQPELRKPGIFLRPSLQSLWLGKRFMGPIRGLAQEEFQNFGEVAT